MLSLAAASAQQQRLRRKTVSQITDHTLFLAILELVTFLFVVHFLHSKSCTPLLQRCTQNAAATALMLTIPFLEHMTMVVASMPASADKPMKSFSVD